MRFAIALVLTATLTACKSAPAPTVVQPGAPGEPSRVVSPEARPGPGFTDADVKFMQGMIGHHEQALEMTELLSNRTTRDDMKMLARRITVSQQDEIRTMRGWLEAHHQDVPAPHAMHMHGAMLMPGMLSEEEMARLSAAAGPEFDRLFLEGMIKHHEGAIVMVRELFASPGAAQTAEIFGFASDVEADQLIEIRRMRGMLAGRISHGI